MTDHASDTEAGLAGAGVEAFVASEVFNRMFAEGMAMVEETAGYLDGEGREQSKTLSRNAALTYAGESMRLTTRLMQVASWLLVQRAVRDGEIKALDAAGDKYRLGGRNRERTQSRRFIEELPQNMQVLVERADRLYERISQIDARLYRQQSAAAPEVSRQISALHDAFGGAKGG